MKRKHVLLLIISLFLLLISCGSKNETNTVQSNGQPDTFVYAIDANPGSTNPITSSDRWGLTFVNTVYSPLTIVNGKGEYENVLADSVSVSDDGLVVTVKLKENLKWSDGEPITAEDVVFTYETKANKENGNYNNLWINDNPVKFVAVDDLTVQFILPEVSVAVSNNIATLTYIIPKHVYENVKDFSVNDLDVVVGSGPYKLKEYKRGEYISFEANPYYYGGEAKIKNLIFRIITNTETRKLALKTGEVDATFILPNEIEEITSAAPIDIYAYTENRIGYVGLNTITDQLKDVRVRQAIFYALNKKEMDRAAYVSEEFYSVPYSFLPETNKYHTNNLEKYEQNLDKARELLKEAGVTSLNINIAFSASDPAQTIQATLIQQQLAQIGINVELQGGDGTAIMAEFRKEGSKTYNMLLNGYIMGNDPDQYRRLFETGGRSNYFKVSSEKIDELFRLGAVELNETRRREIYEELQQEIANEAFIYPIVDNKKVLAVNKRIGDVEKAAPIPIYTLQDFSKLVIK